MWFASRIIQDFLKGTLHAYSLLISITHNKKQNPLFYLLINCLSTRLAPQLLSLKDDYTLHFLNFIITGICNFPANCWFVIISLLIADLSCIA